MRDRKIVSGMPPNLLAHYPYLWELTAVQQAIETAWISASSGGHSLSYWYQQRRFRWCPVAMLLEPVLVGLDSERSYQPEAALALAEDPHDMGAAVRRLISSFRRSNMFVVRPTRGPARVAPGPQGTALDP